VKTKHSEFHNYFISKGIFIQADLKEMIRELSNMMYDAFNEQQIDREFPESRPDRYPKRDALQREGFSKLKAIEAAVQARLWDANKLG
jgi:hypothetical protein